MMRSMFSGVSGLRAHQTRIDVISNNIANVNTVAFKSARVTFQEIFNQTLKGSGAPDSNTGRGGTNPMQIGLSTAIGSIDNIMTRGSVQRTDNPTDLSIDGEGFFIVKGGVNDSPKFTRAGNFLIDKQGNLVTSGGLSVYGWQDFTYDSITGEYVFDTERPTNALNIYQDSGNGNKRIIAATATENAIISGNLNALTELDTDPIAAGNQPEVFNVPITMYDNFGNDYTVNLRMYKDDTYAAGNLVWHWQVDSPVTKMINGVNRTVATVAGEGTITFGADGKFSSETITTALTITPNTNAAIGPVTGASPFSPTLDFSKVTQFSLDSSAAPSDVDGYPTGHLVSFNIGSDGVITGIYSNGKQKPLAMLALAHFENPAGLKKEGENLYSATTNSGNFDKGIKAGTPGVGSLSPGTLEMSNVDLSREFTDMITTERGFQASSRIITTSDEMLQELVNIKR